MAELGHGLELLLVQLVVELLASRRLLILGSLRGPRAQPYLGVEAHFLVGEADEFDALHQRYALNVVYLRIFVLRVLFVDLFLGAEIEAALRRHLARNVSEIQKDPWHPIRHAETPELALRILGDERDALAPRVDARRVVGML